MQRQRRGGGGQSSRGSSPVENGHSNQTLGGQLCAGDSGSVSSGSNGSSSSSDCSSNGLLSGCTMRKTSPLRRAINKLRFRAGRASGSQKGALGAYLAAFVFLVWFGLQTSALLRGVGRGGGGIDGSEADAPAAAGGQEVRPQRELRLAAGRGDAPAVARYGEDDVGPRLAYGIMVYQRVGYSPQMTLDQFARMFEALYDKENTYVIHVDIKSDLALRNAISKHIEDRPNAHEVPSVSVSWAGITVVERTLALMTKAVEVDSSWRYFVNLGHEDYPSASQTEMRRWMKDQKDGTNFIKCWPIEGHDFFGQWEHHDQRLADVHVDDFMGGVREYRSLSGRPGSQERPKSDYRFYKSLQQTTLSRQLTEYAIYSSEARRLLLYMATSKAPDELYFPTLTQLDDRFASMATCNDTRHFSYWIRPGGSWHPEYLTLDHLPLVLEASEFYIRKVEENKGSKPLLDVLDILRAGYPLERTLFILKAWLNRKDENGRLAAEGGPIMEFPEDGTVDEALKELSRRQSQDAETRRCMFLAYVRRRSTKRSQTSLEGAALEAAEKTDPRHSKKPFAKRSGASHKQFGRASPEDKDEDEVEMAEQEVKQAIAASSKRGREARFERTVGKNTATTTATA
eukprot:g10756.t1